MSLEPLRRPADGRSERRVASAASERPDHALTADLAMARDLLAAAMPEALVGPLPDPALARAAEMLIQQQSMGSENYLAAQTLLGILASGVGTLEEPWEILLCADEDDVLALLGKESIGHEVVTSPDGQVYHVHQCSDGSIAAFTPLAA